MVRDKYERTLRQFESYYPSLYEQTVDWWASGRIAITVKLRNGSRFEYDPMDDTIRQIFDRDCDIDESVVRSAFGTNLQKMIPFSGMNKGELASKAGITNAMLSRYIRGNSVPSVIVAHRIARVLGCTIDELFDDTYIR